MSMSVIPNKAGPGSLADFKGGAAAQAKSLGNMGMQFKSQLEQLQRNLKKKVGGPKEGARGISQYFDDDGSEQSDNSEFDDEIGDDKGA